MLSTIIIITMIIITFTTKKQATHSQISSIHTHFILGSATGRMNARIFMLECKYVCMYVFLSATYYITRAIPTSLVLH